MAWEKFWDGYWYDNTTGQESYVDPTPPPATPESTKAANYAKENLFGFGGQTIPLLDAAAKKLGITVSDWTPYAEGIVARDSINGGNGWMQGAADAYVANHILRELSFDPKYAATFNALPATSLTQIRNAGGSPSVAQGTYLPSSPVFQATEQAGLAREDALRASQDYSQFDQVTEAVKNVAPIALMMAGPAGFSLSGLLGGGAVGGAGSGAIMSLLTGGDPLMGALTGGVGSAVGGFATDAGLSPTLASGAAGAASALINGRDPITGALSAAGSGAIKDIVSGFTTPNTQVADSGQTMTDSQSFSDEQAKNQAFLNSLNTVTSSGDVDLTGIGGNLPTDFIDDTGMTYGELAKNEQDFLEAQKLEASGASGLINGTAPVDDELQNIQNYLDSLNTTSSGTTTNTTTTDTTGTNTMADEFFNELIGMDDYGNSVANNDVGGNQLWWGDPNDPMRHFADDYGNVVTDEYGNPIDQDTANNPADTTSYVADPQYDPVTGEVIQTTATTGESIPTGWEKSVGGTDGLLKLLAGGAAGWKTLSGLLTSGGAPAKAGLSAMFKSLGMEDMSGLFGSSTRGSILDMFKNDPAQAAFNSLPFLLSAGVAKSQRDDVKPYLDNLNTMMNDFRGNNSAFLKSLTNPYDQQQSAARGELVTNLGLRGLGGAASSFGNQSLENFDTMSGLGRADILSKGLVNSTGILSGLNTNAMQGINSRNTSTNALLGAGLAASGNMFKPNNSLEEFYKQLLVGKP